MKLALSEDTCENPPGLALALAEGTGCVYEDCSAQNGIKDTLFTVLSQTQTRVYSVWSQFE